jgi:lysophospholipase
MELLYFVFPLLFALPLLVRGQAAASTANTPKIGKCPSGFSLVRQADPSSKQSLSPSELGYIQARKSDVLPNAWKAYLANVQNTNVSLPDYVSCILNGEGNNLPNLGIATSGGGYRAAIFGAGVLNALDGRNSSAVSTGTGGLLQSATYLTGLSGGSWLLTSLIQANFPPFQELIFGSNSYDGYAGWLPQFGLVSPTNDSTQSQEFIAGLIAEIKGKHDAGFPVTIADLWARVLARHFVNGTSAANFFDNSSTHGAGVTFSGLADL